MFVEASKKFKGEMLFVLSGSGEHDNHRYMEFMSVAPSDLPVLKILDSAKNNKKYNYPGKL